MMINHEALERVDQHWSVKSLGEESLKRGFEVARARLIERAVGQQIQISFEKSDQDDELIRKMSLAYEIAAIEGMHALMNPASNEVSLREQCIAAAYRVFELQRIAKIPENDEKRILHVLHVSALAYCGDRWSDLRRWYNENDSAIRVPSVATVTWDKRVLFRLFDCWIRLFRKNRWDDMDQVREIIAGLRKDQKEYESSVLNSGRDVQNAIMAYRLIALYNWAKSTELLAKYMLQGEPVGITSLLDKHFEAAIESAGLGGDAELEVLLRWLHVASRQMVSGSIWWVAGKVNSRVTKFVGEITKQQAIFELLPPQRAALQEQGLLDQAASAVVIEMPTSAGKTLLAEFRILQALNQFDMEHGWVAYVAPTKALTAQITRRLRKDFDPIGVRVEQLTGAVEIDAIEEELLEREGEDRVFDVLVATPEKLQLVIRNKKVPRPLALLVMDEAHNIEDGSRGLRIELLLSTVKRECPSASFLLLMPYVERADAIARWLANDVNAGRSISLGTTPWKPNERIVGTFHAEPDATSKGGWQLYFSTLITSPQTMHLDGKHAVGETRPIRPPMSKLTLGLQTAAMAKIMSSRGTSIAMARDIRTVWNMARSITETMEKLVPLPEEIRLVQDYLRTEISPNFELINMLTHGVGVHHAGLSDEVRSLMELLAEEGKLRVLCTTSTIAQGINFPVSSIFLQSRYVYDPKEKQSKEMPPREFWNLAGRAGRINHDSVGIVGIAAGNDPQAVSDYVRKATGELVSCLVNMLNELEKAGRLNDLELVIQQDQWEDFRCYVAHLWNEIGDLDAVLNETEQLLRSTLGYSQLRASREGKDKADRLLEVTKDYARKLSLNPGFAALADMTGFSPEGVSEAIAGLSQLERQLTLRDWSPEGLFGKESGIADLYGIMLRVPQLAESLKEFGGSGSSNRYIAEVTNAWVNGVSIQDIALQYFGSKENQTDAITDACRAIYRNLIYAGTWGLSALTRLAGIDFESLPEEDHRRINLLPAMLYHGVKSEEAVLMRMNYVPRSIAEIVGQEFKSSIQNVTGPVSVTKARNFLRNLQNEDWERLRPTGSFLTGSDYKTIWKLLSGE